MASLAVLLVTAGVAGAHTRTVSSTAYINGASASPDTMEIVVQVDSGPRCEPGRDVEVYRRRPGEDQLVARAVTNRNGIASMVLARRSGVYYAIVRREVLGHSPDHLHACAFDRTDFPLTIP